MLIAVFCSIRKYNYILFLIGQSYTGKITPECVQLYNVPTDVFCSIKNIVFLLSQLDGHCYVNLMATMFCYGRRFNYILLIQVQHSTSAMPIRWPLHIQTGNEPNNSFTGPLIILLVELIREVNYIQQ